MRVGIGPAGTEEADIFDLKVCAPPWLVQQHRRDGEAPYRFGMELMIVLAYDLAVIRGGLQYYCERCTGESWDKIAKAVPHRCLGVRRASLTGESGLEDGLSDPTIPSRLNELLYRIANKQVEVLAASTPVNETRMECWNLPTGHR